MARIQTPIGGVTTTSAYQDGDSFSLVNLRKKNGALHPVAPRKVLQELSQTYDIVFIHQNNNYKVWIGVKHISDTQSYVYCDILSDPKSIMTSERINCIQQVGNTLSLITNDRILYLIRSGDGYKELGEIPEIPVITFGTTGFGLSVVNYNTLYTSVKPDNFIESTKGLVNHLIENIKKGNPDDIPLFDAHFIRYAFRLYDGSLTKHSPPVLMMPGNDILKLKTVEYQFSSGDLKLNESRVLINSYQGLITYDFSGLDNWKDVIQSVDVFISPALGLSSIEKIRTDMEMYNNEEHTCNLIKEISASMIREVEDISTFYFTESIELGSIAADREFPSIQFGVTNMENLIYQEVMTDDNFSQHKITSNVSYAYNSRLHLAGIKTTFFKGFNSDYFQWGADMYNGVDHLSIGWHIVIEVEIEVDFNIQKVYSLSSELNKDLFLSAFLSYPDPRARRITIYGMLNNLLYQLLTFPLKQHNFLNLSYYLSNGLNPISALIGHTTPIPDMDIPVILNEPNKLKVSELNNPFIFQNQNTYIVGNGAILNMASNAIRISEGQFGQFPLYVFTTQGIYSLSIGSGEVVYSAQSAPTSYEIPTTDVIGSTPFGVVFTSQRGVCVIAGQEVVLLTPQLQQSPKELSIKSDPKSDAKLSGVLFNFGNKSFTEFLNGIELIIYDPYENELIICDKESDFNYVYSFDSKSFYQSTEKISMIVENNFPELNAINNKTLKDYSISETPDTHITLITRPLLFGTTDFKRLERMILRATLLDTKSPESEKTAFILNYFSIDEVEFSILRGIPVKPGDYKDLDMGLFARGTYRQFLFAFAGVVSEKSQIQYLDTEIEKEYNNTKMR